jgi:putative component of membrane protein insertase Oxa1/YidC/SpoIIIJ protein YidD
MHECSFQPTINPYTYHSCHYSSNCSHHPNSSSLEKRGLLDDTTRAEPAKEPA